MLNHTPEIADGPASISPAVRQKVPAQDVIRFKNTGFRFPDAGEDTLTNLNFACRRGQTTAIIGSTGSGKSTVAKLILRFHDITSGSLLLNGRDIREMTVSYTHLDVYKRQIPYLPKLRAGRSALLYKFAFLRGGLREVSPFRIHPARSVR